MQLSAKFEKVSLEQFMKDWKNNFPEDEDNDSFITEIYNDIRLPKRSTRGSAGYDFFLPMDISFAVGGAMMIPTGIRCVGMADDEVLMIFPRSGLGTRHRFVQDNCTSIIDSDYYESDNEGHIFMKMRNNGDDDLAIDKGQAFCQGILLTFHTTIDDNSELEKRNGGLGSTDTKQKYM